MLQYQIPKAYLPGFDYLISLESSQLDRIVHFLNEIPVGIGPKSFHNQFLNAFEEDDPKMRQLAMTIYSLGGLFLTESKTRGIDELIQNLTDSYISQTEQNIKEDQARNFQEYLRRIFSNAHQLFSTYKAFSLLVENNVVFKEAHLITDIRLIFKDDLGNPDRHAIILHQLKIESEENGEERNYFFSLNHSDLLKLKEQIDRSIEKDKLIKESYRSMISFIEITE